MYVCIYYIYYIYIYIYIVYIGNYFVILLFANNPLEFDSISLDFY